MRSDAIRYVVLPGKSPTSHAGRALHDQAFEFWGEIWPLVFAENRASGSSIDPQQFWRQDVVTCLFHEDQVIAQQCYSRYDLRSRAARAQPYLQEAFGPTFSEMLIDRGVAEVMTMECLAVAPEWRRARGAISLGSALITLGFVLQNALRIPAVITISRSDNGARAI